MKEIRVFDEKFKCYRNLSHNALVLSNGQNFEIIETFQESPLKYNKLEIKLRDPNNKKEISYVVDL